MSVTERRAKSVREDEFPCHKGYGREFRLTRKKDKKGDLTGSWKSPSLGRKLAKRAGNCVFSQRC